MASACSRLPAITTSHNAWHFANHPPRRGPLAFGICTTGRGVKAPAPAPGGGGGGGGIEADDPAADDDDDDAATGGNGGRADAMVTPLPLPLPLPLGPPGGVLGAAAPRRAFGGGPDGCTGVRAAGFATAGFALAGFATKGARASEPARPERPKGCRDPMGGGTPECSAAAASAAALGPFGGGRGFGNTGGGAGERAGLELGDPGETGERSGGVRDRSRPPTKRVTSVAAAVAGESGTSSSSCSVGCSSSSSCSSFFTASPACQ